MESVDIVVLRSRCISLRYGLGLLLLLLMLPMSSMAQQIMVGKFKDRTRRGVGRLARAAIVKSLAGRGADLVSYRKYLRIARRYGYRKSRAFSKRAIRRVSRRLAIDGVVTGRVTRRGGRYWISVYLYGPNGRLWLKKKASSRRRRSGAKSMGWIAGRIMMHLAPREEQHETQDEDLELTSLTGKPEADDSSVAADEKTYSPTPADMQGIQDNGPDTTSADPGTKPKEEKKAGDEGWGESLLGSSSGNEGSSSSSSGGTSADLAATFSSGSGASKSLPPDESGGQEHVEFSDESPASYDSSYVSRPAPRSRLRRAKVDDAWLTAGVGIHWRSGLRPLHTTDAFVGMRLQGRGFGGAIWDKGWLNDIGIGFGVDFSIGLEYKYNDGSDSRFDASQTMWHLDGLYRLCFENQQVPDLIVKLGVDGIHSSISDDAEFGVNASYVGPYFGMDAVWNLLHEQLRVVFSFDVLMASAGGDLDAFAGGVRVFAGFRSIMIDWLQMDLGYELTYLGFDDSGTGSSSDTYHNIIFQLGYSLL